jgi:hypothetical protein
MTADDIRIRPGRIRSTRAPRAKSFLEQVLQSAQKAGGLSRGGSRGGGRFGRGRAAGLVASRLLQNRGHNVMIKGAGRPRLQKSVAAIALARAKKIGKSGTSPFIRFGIHLYHSFLTTILLRHGQLHHVGDDHVFRWRCTKLRQGGVRDAGRSRTRAATLAAPLWPANDKGHM